jgi:uncharacterized surface anchored protein
MLPTSSSLYRRVFTRARTIPALAVAAVAAMAACQGDGPSAPPEVAKHAADGAASAVVRPGNGAIVWQLRENDIQTLLAGGQFHLSGPGNVSLNIVDNVLPADQDPTTGAFKVMGLLPGTYTLCETIPPPKYMLPQPPMSPCQSVNVIYGGTTYIGSVYDRHIPLEAWSVVDPVGNLLGNAYFQLHDSTNTVIASFWDNSAQDQNLTAGKFIVEIAVPGYYTLCEALAPSGYVPPAQPCKKIYAAGGLTPYQLGNWVNTPIYSLYFNVTDTFAKALGGTSFVVKRQYYPLQDIHVSDNIMPDRDPKTGKYFVVLPAAGWYVVCQTSAPYGYDPPTLNAGCYPIATSPLVGVPANAGTFIDTPWPVAR